MLNSKVTQLNSEIDEIAKLKEESQKLVTDLEKIISLKFEIVDIINTFYSDSSSLIKQQKLIHIFSEEVDSIFKGVLTHDKILYYNNLLSKTDDFPLSSPFTESVLQ
jgi:hypothetical protein